jgi:hypothetical protein
VASRARARLRLQNAIASIILVINCCYILGVLVFMARQNYSNAAKMRKMLSNSWQSVVSKLSWPTLVRTARGRARSREGVGRLQRASSEGKSKATTDVK